MNVIIYSKDGKSPLEAKLQDGEDFVIRVFDASKIADYKEVNPTVMIFDLPLKDVKDICAVTKFDSSLLILADEIPEGVTIRAEAYDFILRPVNEIELITRVNALSRVIKYRNAAKKIAVTDELTGLYNRKYLHHRLDSEISRSKRYGGDVSCILFDIDFFKTVNDMYGYDWGDILLKKVADMLQALIRKEDVLTRYGDEEFILILPNTSEAQAFTFAERFRKDIEKMEFIPANEEEAHPVTISGGISAFPFLENAEENSQTVIRYAEHALYAAKQRGKNQIIQFSKLNLDY